MAVPKGIVHQTSTSSGTGSLTLASVNGRVDFSDATHGFGTGATPDVFVYYILSRGAAEWEIGTGHMSDATTLVRDTVIASSNAGSLVDFTAGNTVDVTNGLLASNVAQYDILASNANAKGASLIGIEDAAGVITATTVEGALAEHRSAIDTVEAVAAAIAADYLTSADIGTTVQPYDADLAAIAALTPTDSNFIVGNGSAWVTENGNTARTSLGLGTGDAPTFAGLTSTGNINLDSASNADAYLDKGASGNEAVLFGRNAGLNRWGIVLGDTATETGSDVGSDFLIASYTDAGAYKATPMYITRSTGVVNFNSAVLFASTVGIAGVLSLTGGVTGAAPTAQLSLGSYYDNAGDPSISHIDLYGGTYGFGISSGKLNFISQGGHDFYVNNTLTSPAFRLDTSKLATFYGNVTIDGTGALTVGGGLTVGASVGIGASAAATTGIELGDTSGTATTPYIDFHSGATAVDYDARIIASGGSGSTGGGTINITSAALQWNASAILHWGNIGVNVQAYDADLDAIAALSTTAAGRSVLTIADPGADRIVAWDDTGGAMLAMPLANFTAETAPASGDKFLIYGAEGDLRAVDYDNLPSGGGRTTLSAARTYYVRTDGSDSNDGLTNSSGGAFLTIQKAMDVIAALDCSTYSVTVQVGTGTYTGTVVLPRVLGSGTMTLTGDTTTPSNVVISVTSANAITGVDCGRWTVQGFKITATTAGSAIYASTGATISLGKMEFGACAYYHVQAADGGKINFTVSYSMSGNSTSHWRADQTGVIETTDSITITLTGTPAFTAFCWAVDEGYVNANSLTFSGSATGSRYTVSGNATIYTNGGGASYLPGNSAGSSANGGVYY